MKNLDRRVKMMVAFLNQERIEWPRKKLQQIAAHAYWPITLLCVVVYNSIQLSSGQGGNVPGRMKSKLCRGVVTPTSIGVRIMHRSSSADGQTFSRFHAIIYLQSQIYLSTFLQCKIHKACIGHFRRTNHFSFYSCPYITVYFLFQK